VACSGHHQRRLPKVKLIEAEAELKALQRHVKAIVAELQKPVKEKLAKKIE
jgi:hypothetical protein